MVAFRWCLPQCFYLNMRESAEQPRESVMRRFYKLLLVICLLLFSCTLGEYKLQEGSSSCQPLGTSHQSPTPGSGQIYSRFLGKNVSALVAEKGEPDIILNMAPLGSDYTGPVSTIAYVYFPGQGSGDWCCTTYVVDLQTDTILRFYCR